MWSSQAVERPPEYEDEPLGTKAKFWCRPPGQDRDWLFKFSREREGVVRGEDWAEWVVHHFAELMQVPTAKVLPAVCEGSPGILSRSVVDSAAGERLVHGNSVLARENSAYDGGLTRENPEYTVANVHRALRGAASPLELTESESFDAFDVWAGYLVLDAVVAGRDRHHENWAVIEYAGSRRLAPSFDHGNALGFQENDEHRRAMLDQRPRFLKWLGRGTSHHFAGRPSLVTLACEALAMASPSAADFWASGLRSIPIQDVESILAKVSGERMSDVARRFALEIIIVNRERLISEYQGD